MHLHFNYFMGAFHLQKKRYMRKRLLLLVCLPAALSASAQLQVSNVTVVDVEKRMLIPGQSVLINDGRISAIGPHKSGKTTEKITTIDGKGKFLMPGLVDAHVHFFQSGGIYTRPDGLDLRKYVPYAKEIDWTHLQMGDLLRRYLAAGITSVVDLGATYNFLRRREQFREKADAPSIYMTGPLITTWESPVYKGLQDDEPFSEMKTTAEARKFVLDQLPYKPDLIKIWFIVRGPDKDSAARALLPLVRETILTAQEHGLRVAVHATEQLTARLAVEAGASFLVHSIDDSILEKEFIALLKKNKVVLCPTLQVSGNYSKVFGQAYLASIWDKKYAHPVPLGSVNELADIPDTSLVSRFKRAGTLRMLTGRRMDSIRKQNLALLCKAGIPVATGTDAGNIGTQHASSYFAELHEMKEAGMSMWELLQASTVNGARAVGAENEFGTVSIGKQANLILLNNNPLDSIAAWQSIYAIINKGQLIKPDTLLCSSPEVLAQQQLNAYNEHNLEAFLKPYADDVEIYEHPAVLKIKGKAEMREKYRFIETTPGLHCRLLNRIVQNNTVIDQEEILVDGRKPRYGTAIYTITNGRISKVYFIH